MTLRFKPEVRIGYCEERLTRVLEIASVWSLRTRVDVEINSINDGAGVHAPTSLHPFDLAVDLDTVGDTPADLDLLAEFLRRWLGREYDVVFEGDHVHVEWDARRPPLRRTVS